MVESLVKVPALLTYTHSGKEFTTSDLPPNHLIKWSEAHQKLQDAGLIKITGYADCITVDTIEGIRFREPYWQSSLTLGMYESGVWVFLPQETRSAPKLVQELEAVEQGKEGAEKPEPLQGVLALQDKKYILERMTQILIPLEFNDAEKLNFFKDELIPYSGERQKLLAEITEKRRNDAVMRTLADQGFSEEKIQAAMKALLTVGKK